MSLPNVGTNPLNPFSIDIDPNWKPQYEGDDGIRYSIFPSSGIRQKIPLPTGREIALSLITFDKANHKAMYGTLDVTPYMKFEELATLAGFDDAEKDFFLQQVYVANHPDAPPVGSTSVLENFGTNIANDISLGTGSVFKKYLTWGAIAGCIALAFVFRDELKAIFKKLTK